MSDHSHSHDDGKVHAHVSSFFFLCAIFGALIFLTVVTVAASRFDFGSANTIIAVLIATAKATLVATFFMHLKYDKGFHALVFVMSFVFLGVFLFITLEDLDTRGRVDDASTVRILERRGEQAPGGFNLDPRGVQARERQPAGGGAHH
ncbi:MAG: cytochrome C oxidase subunit IV family protein [Myxococcales bacterium]|nr:cytochrome C oxidase subunit IV family protein [Myxococcales bacterium]